MNLMKKKLSKKGFTLAELLVVVAIIAVLVAIAIPIFNASTKKAEEAVEVANARSAYAEGMISVVDGSYTSAKTYTYGDKTYTFTYDSGTKAWSIAVVAVTGKTPTIYNATITDFNSIVIDGN